jgi:hypothetical protein
VHAELRHPLAHGLDAWRLPGLRLSLLKQCLWCGEVSPHEHWYHYPNDEPAAEENTEEENVAASRAEVH